MSNTTAVVWKHDKGFWVADVYFDGSNRDPIGPDWYCTGKTGGGRSDVTSQVKRRFPDATIVDGGDDE